MNPTITLKFLAFLGVHKKSVILEFNQGLNIIYGASDTGKTYILQCIDFMLGAKGIRDIPEIKGYTDILLGIEISTDKQFTISRKISGGNFVVFEGLHREITEEQVGQKLQSKHKDGREDTLSAFLLDKIKLKDKRLKKNVRGETNSLSFRNLSHLIIVDEEKIQKQISPIFTGQVISKTSEISLFNLLLTGIDNSYLESRTKQESNSASDIAKVQILDELILELKANFGNDDPDEKTINLQLVRLEETLSSLKESMLIKEGEFNNMAVNLSNLKNINIELHERDSEIKTLINRFSLLESHYLSDLNRLEALKEASNFISSFESVNCPLCGVSDLKDCEDIDTYSKVVEASQAEYQKIEFLKNDLTFSISKLNEEQIDISEMLKKNSEQIQMLEEKINLQSPKKIEMMDQYAEALSIKVSLENSLKILDQIYSYEGKRKLMINKPKEELTVELELQPEIDRTDLFAKKVGKILVNWGVVEDADISFDHIKNDLIIDGKSRTSRGKGMRSITHAAFTVGLQEYCKEHDLPHPGFIILDSPLLAYREPESDDEELVINGVSEKFYNYLKSLSDRQIIIIENNDPPQDIIDMPFTLYFSKSSIGRYGLFPKIDI
ncbi:hypothetical protein [Acinetobacter gerneri]|uniref:hypothetical protein n=1 Tax=Acinetobacter gerneri TaxID=202952 RepID=UPI003A8579CF